MFKNFDKTSIIGVVVCIALMLVLFFRMSNRTAEAQAELANQPQVVVDGQPQPVAVPVPEAEKPVAAPAQPAGKAAAVDSSLPVGAAPRAQGDGKLFELSRDGEVTFTIAPASGVVSSTLPKYRMDAKQAEDSQPVVLGCYDYPFMTLGAVQGQLSWQPLESAELVVSENGAKSVVATRLSADGALRITETWSLREGDAYEIAYGVTFRNLSGSPVVVDNIAVEAGAISATMSGAEESGYGGVAFMQPPASRNHCGDFTASSLKKFAEARAKIANPNLTQADHDDAMEDLEIVHDLAWAGVHTRYFLQCVRSLDADFKFASLEAFSCESVPGAKEQDPHGRFRARLVLPVKTIAAGGEWQLNLSGFSGPKDLNMLDAKGIGMEGTIGVDRFFWGTPGWMGALSKFFLNSLLYLSRLFPGRMALGFALIMLTLLVKLVLWPLSHKSSRSMKKMQEIQPQLKELREKYKSDPQEMYRRQQELFKANHVSQFGGCLPMLVQVPIFFALFNTFRGAIELRHASFLWAADLSMPDTVLDLGFVGLNPMALIMVGTMLWQQAITPTGDPSQKRMMMMMSIVFTYFLYTQPSGLTLYMTVNQLLSMLQFHIIKKLDAREAASRTAPAK